MPYVFIDKVKYKPGDFIFIKIIFWDPAISSDESKLTKEQISFDPDVYFTVQDPN